MKVETNEKDLIFTDNGDNEGFRILDNAAGVKVAGTIELGHASDTTIARASSGAITVEGTAVLLAGAQTGITTILNTSTKVGRDTDNLIDFTTNDTIALRLNNNDVLSFTESSQDVIIKPLQDSKDIVFQQYDGTEVARVEDNGTFNIVTDKLAINGTAVTATAAELNLLDGGTSVGGSITLADSDGVVVNDGGTMKTIPASDVKTYAGISGDITLGTDEKLILDTTPSDDDGSGVVIKGTIASGVNAGETVYGAEITFSPIDMIIGL